MTLNADIAPPAPLRGVRFPRVLRTRLRDIKALRLLRGGRISDPGRLPRYAGVFLLAGAAIWAPILSYLETAPLRYTSGLSLILPGSGASASVNLDRIGQASSYANSPFSSPSVSPTETYKRLLAADRILGAAAGSMDMPKTDFGKPRIELVDQTGLIHVQMTGNSPADAQARADALLAAFFTEIDALRNDEQAVREDGGRSALEDYRASVAATREEIARLQRETGLINAAQYQTLVGEADGLRADLAALEQALVEKSRAVEVLRATLGIDAAGAAATLKLHADAEFNAIIAEMAAHAGALAEAEGKYGPNHPALRAAHSDHQATKRKAQQRAAAITGLNLVQVQMLDLSPAGGRVELLAQLVREESARAGLAAEVDSARARLARADARVLDLIGPAARLEDLERDFAVAEAVFASAMARSQTSKVDLYASYPLVQVLENPSLPDAPSSPRKKLAIAAGVAATFMVLIGLAMGWLRRPLIDRLLHTGDQG
ncbi:hypothetical protein [Rhodovulum adriaticum]|uniref:Uncharacterized protein involved in exopolysaccharide biosynthesis n=1 Tax=Rhodovulum adriaticum TaxID=35804 RepID=A0A4R2NZJ1_RHOAD|nr:hypothetical protein [Rhodovulum adriaticum]MBK1634804.1 hypothetical protein [Rhodovulum adriaticum]TCP27622.1 uncharacterized protein involved in exopolysaccharide biosynthesis [Rhodovulum adriaticum]